MTKLQKIYGLLLAIFLVIFGWLFLSQGNTEWLITGIIFAVSFVFHLSGQQKISAIISLLAAGAYLLWLFILPLIILSLSFADFATIRKVFTGRSLKDLTDFGIYISGNVALFMFCILSFKVLKQPAVKQKS